MKILIDLTSLSGHLSGIERYAMCIAKELVENSDENFVLVFKNEINFSFKQYSSKPNVSMVTLEGKNKLLFNQFVLPHAVHQINADVNLFMAFPVPFFTHAKNMIDTIHDVCFIDCPETMNKKSELYFKVLQKAAVKKCRKIITISEFSKKRIIETLKVPEEKIIMIYCGIADSFIAPVFNENVLDKYHLPSNYILSLSTIEPRKNLALLIKSYEELVLANKLNADLVLAGRKGWKVDNILADVDKSVLERIHFTGFIDDSDLPTIYHMAKLFVFPSKYEGFGIPPLEAMSCGTLVLSSDSTALPEVCGDAALYFANDNQKSLSEQLVNAFSLSDEERDNYINAGKTEVTRFSWKKEAIKLRDYIETLK